MAEKPYYEPHYLELIKQAREKHLGNIQATSAAIIRLYREAADLAERAAASRKGSLSQRWADEYAKSLAKRAAELEAGLYDVTLQGLKRSAELPAAAMGQWWEAVGGQSFRDAFAMPQDNVLAGIIEGGFYKDNQGLSRRIWRLADSFEKDIGYIVQRGIAEKKSALELARDLEQYVKPPAAREWDWGKVYPNLSGKKVDYNAQRLARTAINHAYFLDNVRVCTENPFVTAMHWDLSNAHDERQVIPFGPDECDDYAEHDEGLGEGNFKPDELPCPHPQCLCVQWAVIPDSLEDIGARIGAWAYGEPDERLDEWYAQYGGGNPNGDPKEILRNGGELLQNAAKSGKILSGAISGGLNPDSQEAQEHADRYYELVRKMTTDVQRIAENTGFDEDLIRSIKEYIFLEKHDLGDGRYDYFDSSYLMAQSWQRMIDGKKILPHDVTLLNHEKMEKELVQQGLSQNEAHEITSAVYNYSKEAREYYGEIEENNKK